MTASSLSSNPLFRQRNPVFPYWMTANVILVSEILPRLGVYPQLHGNNGLVQVLFLPEEIFYMVPEEDHPTFAIKYSEFVTWAVEEVFGEGFFSQFLYEFADQSSFYRMSEAVSSKVAEYNATHYPSYERKFLEFMGIDPVFSIT